MRLFVSRRRLAAVEADRERLRAERDQFGKDARACTRENAALRAEVQRLTAEAAGQQGIEDAMEAYRISLAGAIGEHAAAYSMRRLIGTVATLTTDTMPRAQYEVQKRRADRLQLRLDQALGLDSVDVLDGRHWQETRQDKGTVRP